MMMTSSSSSLSVRATPKTGIIAGSANDKRKTAVVKNNNKNTDDGLWNAKIAFDDDDDDDANTTNEKETQQHKGMMSTRRRQLAMSAAAAVASVALSVGRPMEAQALSLKGKNKNGVYWIEPKVRHAYPLCFVFLLLLLLASTHVFCLLRTTEQRHGDVSIHREIRR